MTRQEFNTLSESIRARLLALAKRFNSCKGLDDDPEDVVQEALLTLWRLSEEGYPIRDAEALAVKITKNTAVAHYRRQKNKVRVFGGYDTEGGIPATVLTDAHDTRIIREKLYGSLSQTQRKYLELRNETGLSLDEIASATGKPKASIKTSISTARKQMLEQIKKQL